MNFQHNLIKKVHSPEAFYLGFEAFLVFSAIALAAARRMFHAAAWPNAQSLP
jgi:hypothetical protein